VTGGAGFIGSSLVDALVADGDDVLVVFAAALAAGALRVVNTSTGGAIYGETDLVPMPESAPADPLSAYASGNGRSSSTADGSGAATVSTS
jgi:nucleoside-diphosphate-sugar epimerase